MTSADVSFHRRSIRLRDYDYSSPGAYFVTMVTKGHKCIFGKIIDSVVTMYDLGRIAYDCWFNLTDHFPHIDVNPFIVMPNHVHGIITIIENDRRGTIYRAPTMEQFGKPVAGSLPTIIRTYKAAVSRLAKKELGCTDVWHRNYYEHIIRNQTDLDAITAYILTNPSHWFTDPERAF